MNHVIPFLLLLTSFLSAKETAPKLPPAAKQKIDFKQHIEPILKAKCIRCHSAERQRGGLRLDSREQALKGSNSGSIVKPGDAIHSRLMIVTAGLDAEVKMPPGKRDPLTTKELSLLRAWIEQGLVWPKSSTKVVKVKSDHWGFQIPERPAIPKVINRAWIRNPIDTFILARLEREGIDPSQEADRPTLIRRLSLDIRGLPPTPEEVDAFVSDRSVNAYEKVVERYLASPAYGERWARHWLDAARYADSDGFEKDRGRPFAWRWRDQLINALNRDQSYDQFVLEQLAGDLLPNATLEQKVATGFHRNTLTNTEGGVDKEQFRVEAVVDRVNTTAKTFLGLTLACAQCHDHKYDPLSQREFYQFFAFFNSDQEVNISAPTRGQKTKAQTLALGKPRKTHVMIRGDFLRKGVEVSAGVPAVLGSIPTPKKGKRLTRLDLAKWIASAKNPLTTRVLVNQIWHRYFGRGLVATLDDFGKRAEKPSHPELLDWLALEVPRLKWSLKSLHRLIVTSATYRQSSHVREKIYQRDPLNVLLSRQSRIRLDAELIRDTALASSGLLVRTVGGPSVRPPQPKDFSKLTYANSAKWVESKGADRYRRGLYIWFQRTSPYPMLMTFDSPDSNVCCVKRERSCTALQALTLLNDRVFVECAQSLARWIQDRNVSSEQKVTLAFRRCLGRKPDEKETARLSMLYDQILQYCQKHPQSAARLVGQKKSSEETTRLAAWTAVTRAILNLDEMITRE